MNENEQTARPKHAPDPTHSWTDKDYARIVACVNACAGLNPEAIPALRVAAVWAETMLSDIEPPADDQPAGEWNAGLSALRAALAAVKGVGK